MKMKIYNIKGLLLALSITIGMASCEKVLDINKDPNNASTATPKLVLPTAQSQLGATIGYAWNWYGGMWAQYWTGGYGVSTSQVEYFNMVGSDVDGSWTRAYARSLEDMHYLQKSGQPIYAGMAKIMSAYLFQMLTDLHGDIPFSQALKGQVEDGSITTPKYDKQEDVYAALIPLIDEGIAGVTIVPAPGVVYQNPSSDDLMYGGDISKWVKFANTLKLKVLVRKGDYAGAKALIDAGTPFITSASDEAKFRYFETAQNTNPLYARFMARADVGMYFVASKTSVDTLKSLSDPRINKIYTIGTSGNVGVFSGDINDNTSLYPSGGANTKFDRPGPLTFDATVPVFFISSWESYFLQAEVLIRNGQNASTLFENAVQASFDYFGAGSASSYVATLGFTGTQDNQLNVLALQKWISMNGLQMVEGWLETVRFDRPGNDIFKGGIFHSPINNSLGANKFPSSFVLPQQEISYNPNSPKNVTVTSKRFWDN